MKNRLIFLSILTALAARGEWSGQFNSERAEFRWPAAVGQSHTVLSSTNLLEGFAPLATVQATPPSNVWWMAADLPTRFFKLQDDTATDDQIATGDFFQGLENWTVLVNDAATATVSVADGELFADITEGGTAHWHIALRQFGLELLNGSNYVVEFDARTASNRTIQVRMQSQNGSTNYVSETITISTNMQTVQIAFTMSDPTDLNARIQFSFGEDNNNVWIDDVVLRTGGLRDAARLMNERMGRGNNFMASKAMNDNGAAEDYALLNDSYFSHCRIGYKLDEIATNAPDFLIPSAHMQTLQNMVDWCLAEGLIAVIDPVHNWANHDDPALEFETDDLPKLGKIWEQVAARFADYDLKNVVFEVMNEPHSEDDVAQIIATSLTAIRSQAGNERRIVIVPGDGFSTRQALIDALDNNEIPANDPFLIGTFHYYDPKTFTAQGASTITWGTAGEFEQVVTDFDAVVSANNGWASSNGTESLPVYLGEFGVDNGAPAADRKEWLSWIRMQAEARGFSWAHWNMYQNTDTSKGMGPWTDTEKDFPATRSFDADPLEALTGRYEVEEGANAGGVTVESTYAGFTGTGYAAFPTNTGAATWVRVENIFTPVATNYTVKIHYASVSNRLMRLVVRNDTTTTHTLDNQLFPATGGLNSWSTLNVPLPFEAGELGNLKFVATPDPGVQLDWIQITLP